VHETFNRLNYLPNAISRSAQTENELIAQATKAIAAHEEDPDRQQKRVIVQHYVGDLSGPLATENIVRVLQRMGESTRRDPYSWQQTRLRLVSAARSTAARTRRALFPNKSLSAYMEQKFPKLAIEELAEVLDKIGRARGRPLAVEVAEHPQLANCFVLRRREPMPSAQVVNIPEPEPA
jgi:hypothetical protein